MKKIRIGKSNKYALINDKDFERISKFKWHSTGKAIKNSYNVCLSKMVKNIPQKDKRIIDHINNNIFDNRKQNLRIVTDQQNHWNRKINKNSTSGFKGVSWEKRYKKWHAYIRKNGKRYNLGRFENKILAAKKYDRKAKELFGKYAKLNFK